MVLFRLLWIGVLLVGCVKRGAIEDGNSVALQLSAADAAWSSRQDSDAGRAALDAALGMAPLDTEVRWRQSRLYVFEGATATLPDRSRRAYADARAAGLACLEVDVVFKAARSEDGLDSALGGLEEKHQLCASWTAYAWARWLVLFGGEAASLDVPRVRILADHAVESGLIRDQMLATWALGLLSAVGPEADPELARKHLERVTRLAPNSSEVLLDLARLIAIPEGDDAYLDDLRRRAGDLRVKYPEDLAALDQLMSL